MSGEEQINDPQFLPYCRIEEYLEDYKILIILLADSAAAALEARRQNLAGYSYPEKPDEELCELVQETAAHIKERERITVSNAFLKPVLLRDRLSLDDFTYFCVMAALCCELFRDVVEAFIRVHGRNDLSVPDVGSLMESFALYFPVTDVFPSTLVNPLNTVCSLLFEQPLASHTFRRRPVSLRHCVSAFLLGKFYLSQPLLACVFYPEEVNEQPVFLDRQLNYLRRELSLMGNSPVLTGTAPRLFILSGTKGSGRTTALQYCAKKAGLPLLFIRLEQLYENTPAVFEELAAAAVLWEMIPCFYTATLADNPILLSMLSVCRRYALCLFIVTEPVRGVPELLYPSVNRLDFVWPNLSERSALFAKFAVKKIPESELLAAKYRLTAGQIKAALKKAEEAAESEDFITASQLADAVLQSNTGKLREIADYIPAIFSWDDLVLDEQSIAQLRAVCDRIRYRSAVETGWGLSPKAEYGNGISALLFGPPGTGKTMSAQVIANELGLPLYRINLAQLISKYIGETAKNLDKVFGEANNSNVILFFDEADAIFTKRTEVKNSNDRHANSESAYLLQKIEQYPGISLLATNLANNFDEAFRRRINFMINIPLPSPEQRLLLWKTYLPSTVPLSTDVDLSLFADNLEFSGSVIKSSATQAAYFAVPDGGSVTMRHIAAAVCAELKKAGRSAPHFLLPFLK